MWGNYECTKGCSVHWGFHTNSIVFPITFPHIYHDIPQCTEHSQCAHDIPTVLMISPSVLNIPRCTAETLCRVSGFLELSYELIKSGCSFPWLFQHSRHSGQTQRILMTDYRATTIFEHLMHSGLDRLQQFYLENSHN